MALPEFFSKADIEKMCGVPNAVVTAWYEAGLPYTREETKSERSIGSVGRYVTTPMEFIQWFRNQVERKTIERIMAQKRSGELDKIDVDIDEKRPATMSEERLRLLTEQANNKALTNAQLRAELGEIAMFEQVFRGTMIKLSPSIMSLGARCASDLAAINDPKEIKLYLTEECKRTLTQAVASFEEGFEEFLLTDKDGERIEGVQIGDGSRPDLVPMNPGQVPGNGKLNGGGGKFDG